MNAINIIFPYKKNGTWMFDDKERDIMQEPFVAGADSILEVMSSHLPNAHDGFKLIFSDKEFPGYHFCAVWESEEGSGNWYTVNENNMRGWLCPALLVFFKKAPKTIFIRVEAK